MKKINKRETIFLLITGVVLAGYIVFQFIILPIRDNGRSIIQRIEVAQRKLAQNQQIINSGETVDGQMEKLVNLLGVSGSEGGEFSAIISKLEMTAKEANIHVVNIQPQRSINKDITRVFPVELVIDGQWSAIAKFLYLVQDQTNFLNVEELSLEKYSDSTALLRGRIILSRTRVIVGSDG